METTGSSVVSKIYKALSEDKRTSKAVIEVGFHQGIATLTGNVKSASMMQAAEEITRAQPGVLSVVNEMKIG
jgi:osmotically-inducible protein OsmY